MNGNGTRLGAMDLEIGLQGRENNRFFVDLRCQLPGKQEDLRLEPIPVTFPFAELNLLLRDNAAYGRKLADSLFDGKVGEFLAEARSVAESGDPPLPMRLRLIINPSAEALHSLRWETLMDPGRGPDAATEAHLLTSERVFFSRFIFSADWRSSGELDLQNLRAVVVIASPGQLEQWKPERRPFALARLLRTSTAQAPDGSRLPVQPLAPLDPEEVERARQALDRMQITWLVSRNLLPEEMEAEAPTLDNLINALEKGCDILYLACHGALVRIPHGAEVCDEPRLWLEDENGNVNVVAGIELAARIRELMQPPRLVVLASCQSAGTGSEAGTSDEGALAALGPQLARAGVPAILAMQGNVKMRTAAAFLPKFFQELRTHGQIDRAAARARAELVRNKYPDSYMPVLFMRLRHGVIFRSGTSSRGDFQQWHALKESFQRQRCVIILGNSLLEEMLGSTRLLARRWAETHRFPMAEHHCEDLAQVAQYLAVTQYEQFPRFELENYLRQEVMDRYEALLNGQDRVQQWEKLSLDELLNEVVTAQEQETGQPSPFGILASLPCPLFLMTSPSSLLTNALQRAGKDPRVGFFKWQEYSTLPDSALSLPADAQDRTQQPVVYHLFGHLQDLDSLVLTEDDYFDYLLRIARNHEDIPAFIRSALVRSTLLFLGFQLDDWAFRIILRSIMNLPGSELMKRQTHVAVQINPHSSHVTEPEKAEQYLEKYFEKKNIRVYPNTTEEFLQELQKLLPVAV